jgi:hypothetical protein
MGFIGSNIIQQGGPEDELLVDFYGGECGR